MTTLKQILEPLMSLTKGDKLLCIQAVKKWLQQKRTCKIQCENCFLSVQCPYPKILEELET